MILGAFGGGFAYKPGVSLLSNPLYLLGQTMMFGGSLLGLGAALALRLTRP